MVGLTAGIDRGASRDHAIANHLLSGAFGRFEIGVRQVKAVQILLPLDELIAFLTTRQTNPVGQSGTQFTVAGLPISDQPQIIVRKRCV